MATRSAETFEKRFKPNWKDDDKEPLAGAPIINNNLWTLVDPQVPSGMQYWIPGFHYVNRVGYIYTEVAWTEKDTADEYRRW